MILPAVPELQVLPWSINDERNRKDLNFKKLISELKRRNVFRVATAYAIAGWLIIQIATSIFPAFNFPDWTSQFVIILTGIGFPIALIIAWAFELTPEGLKKSNKVQKDESITPQTGQKINRITIAALSILVLFMIVERVFFAQAGTNEETSFSETTRASIAVLPFEDYSPDGSQEYFGRGIAEELLNALAQFPELKVAARTSAFALSTESGDLKEVGEKLGVEYILEGSVRKSEDRLRITSQLIRAEDGYHLWSETYERNLTDIFKIQDEIVEQLSRTMQVRLGVGAGAGRAEYENVNPQAYELYLKGLNYWGDRELQSNRIKAFEHFQSVTELDPDFADGWAALGISLVLSPGNVLGFENSGEFSAKILETLNKAMELDPENGWVHSAYGTYYSFNEIDIEKARYHTERALELSPNSAFSHYSRAFWLENIGDLRGAKMAVQRTMMLDPLNCTVSRIYAIRVLAADGYGAYKDFLNTRGTCVEDPVRSAILALGAIIDGEEEEAVFHYSNLNELYRKGETRGENMVYAVATGTLAGDTTLALDVVNRLLDAEESSMPTMMASVMASNGRYDKALNILEANYDHKVMFQDPFDTFIIAAGNLAIPDTLRRMERYHRFWQRPGLAELRLARESRGITAGLPLDPVTN